MRKPRDYDAELKALDDKARQLRQKRIVQLGELVIACGADGLSPEELAGEECAVSVVAAGPRSLSGYPMPDQRARRKDRIANAPMDARLIAKAMAACDADSMGITASRRSGRIQKPASAASVQPAIR